MEFSVTLKKTIELSEPISCGACGIVFSFDEYVFDNRKKSKETFFCPNGHPRAFVESEADRLRKQLIAANSTADFNKRRLEQEIQTNRNLKGQITKIKNRINNGVCPCCNRTFQNLARHMKTKHPEILKQEKESL